MLTQESLDTGISPAECKKFAVQARGWAKGGDAFVYFISAAKERNPAAAQMLIEQLRLR